MRAYADLIDLPRYRLRHHSPMPMQGRAAQFSAFAALTGYDEDITEAARLTDSRAELSEDALAELDAAFQRMLANASGQPEVVITWFQPDAGKAGGRYVISAGCFRFYEQETGNVYLTDGTVIPARSICGIASGNAG